MEDQVTNKLSVKDSTNEEAIFSRCQYGLEIEFFSHRGHADMLYSNCDDVIKIIVFMQSVVDDWPENSDA